MPEIIPCGNEEFDRMFGGGIPFPSLMLIEGGHGTGKSVIAATAGAAPYPMTP